MSPDEKKMAEYFRAAQQDDWADGIGRPEKRQRLTDAQFVTALQLLVEIHHEQRRMAEKIDGLEAAVQRIENGHIDRIAQQRLDDDGAPPQDRKH